MKKIFVLMSLAAGIMLGGCKGGSKEKKGDLGDMKVKLEKLKKDKEQVDANIHQLEAEIAKADPEAAKQSLKLVSVDTLHTADFTHFIELQGKIDAYDIVYVAPRSMPAQVRQLYVKKGDRVQKGQLLVKLDDAVMLQQMDGLKVQLAYAENIYNRQKNLWDQGIGTEVQLVTAKNNVDAMKKQISTLAETWQTSFVYAPISGVADEVNVKVGEIFNGGTPASPQIKLVNGSSLKIVTEVPENYVARIKKGDNVEVIVPESGKPPFKSTINVIGATINPNTRSFTTEAKLPSDPILKPNQLATMRIQDYQSKATITVPVNVVQTDEKGKYVYVMEKSGDKMVARKKPVDVGESYAGIIEIKNGLAGGEQLITEGYQTIYDGQAITTGK
jgi:membrane fusion protein, multidrug efflux system